MEHPWCVRQGICMEDVHYGEEGPDRLLDRIVNCCHSWCSLGLRVSCC
jgi:hypothetical protein